MCPDSSRPTDYDDVLPSFNFRYHLTDELQLRFAAAKAIVRPTFSQMMPYTSLSFTFESDGFTPDDVSPYTGSGGNPLLHADQVQPVRHQPGVVLRVRLVV